MESMSHDSCGTDGSSFWVATTPPVIGFSPPDPIGSFVVPSSRKTASRPVSLQGMSVRLLLKKRGTPK
jgi:hypothetical protein